MKPIPVVFNIGPVQIHTYGIGLAIAFYFTYRYFEARMNKAGLESDWIGKSFLWIIAAAIVGARIVHVVANISYYSSNLGEIPIIWHGGLSSFGGLAAAIPAGIYLKKRYAPNVSLARTFDELVPSLIVGWSIGRILGPQLMFQGGGRPTNAWYGLQYAGQVGYRIPVPVLQATEDFVVFLIVRQIYKMQAKSANPLNPGSVALIGTLIWSVTRFWDEFFWLAVPRLWDAVEVFALILVAVTAISLAYINRKGTREVPNGNVSIDLEGEPTDSSAGAQETTHEESQS